MDLKVSTLKQARWVFDKAEIILGPNSSNEDIIFRAVFFNFFKLSSNMEFQSDNCAGLIAKNQFILRRLSAMQTIMKIGFLHGKKSLNVKN